MALLTEVLLIELISTLSREKFAEQIAQRQLTVSSIIEQYCSAVVFVEPAEVPLGMIRDPKARMMLACAAGGKADFIVSGDKDLLVLTKYEGVQIVNADQFLPHLSSE